MVVSTKDVQTIDRAGRRLRKTLERQFLEKLIALLNSPGDDEIARLCQVSEMLSDIRKQDAAVDKNVVALLVAREKASMARADRRSDGVAPFGPEADGTPEGRRAFRQRLTRTIRDIYGLDTPDDGSPAVASSSESSEAGDRSA